MVTQQRKSACAGMLIPATTLSAYRRWSRSGARLAHDFSFIRFPSSRTQTPPMSMAETRGEAWYAIFPDSARTGVTRRSSGRVSAVHWFM